MFHGILNEAVLFSRKFNLNSIMKTSTSSVNLDYKINFRAITKIEDFLIVSTSLSVTVSLCSFRINSSLSAWSSSSVVIFSIGWLFNNPKFWPITQGHLHGKHFSFFFVVVGSPMEVILIILPRARHAHWRWACEII